MRIFQLGDPEDLCQIFGDVAVDLIKKMPRVEEIYLLAHMVDSAELFGLKTLDRLRILQIDHQNSTYPLDVLAKNKTLGKLTHLLIQPHAHMGEDEAYIGFAGVKALVNSPHLKSLTHLRLRQSDMGDKGCKEIVRSGILKRLKVLDIQGGCVTDDGAKALAGSPDLKNLELLNISKNRLTKIGVAALKETGVKLMAGEQFEPLAEGKEDQREYLMDGDFGLFDSDDE